MSQDNKEYEKLKTDKKQNEQKQSSTQAQIDDLDDKIKAMKDAYKAIDTAKEELKDIRKAIKKMPSEYDDKWKGRVSKEVYTSCKSEGELYSSYTSYIDAIDEIEDDLNLKLTDYENEKIKQEGFLVTLRTAWNDLCTKIQNFFN